MELLIQLGLFLVLLGLGFTVGRAREAKHFREIQRRERELINLPARADKTPSPGMAQASLVTGSVVVATDYFKMTVAALRNIFGGRVTTYEALMDRARREAVLRLKDQARAWGAEEIIHLRMVSTRLGQSQGIEVVAVATALKK